MRKITLALTVLVALFFIPTAKAGTTSANMTVSVTVDSMCFVSADSLAFSDYAPLGANLTVPKDGTSSVVLTCTAGVNATITMDVGSHASVTQNRMAQGSDFINYNLYKNAMRTIPWGSGAAAFTTGIIPDTNPRTYIVYGQIPAAQSVPSGAYTDIVIVSINF